MPPDTCRTKTKQSASSHAVEHQIRHRAASTASPDVAGLHQIRSATRISPPLKPLAPSADGHAPVGLSTEAEQGEPLMAQVTRYA